jgi:hypothetical protein
VRAAPADALDAAGAPAEALLEVVAIAGVVERAHARGIGVGDRADGAVVARPSAAAPAGPVAEALEGGAVGGRSADSALTNSVWP